MMALFKNKQRGVQNYEPSRENFFTRDDTANLHVSAVRRGGLLRQNALSLQAA